MIDTNSILGNDCNAFLKWSRDKENTLNRKNNSYVNKMGYVYTLKLEGGNYYVGYTERPIQQRFNEHLKGVGSHWTRKYKPLDIISFVPGNMFDENEITYKLMKRYGYEKVRGGSYCSKKYESMPKEVKFKDDRNFVKFPHPEIYKEYIRKEPTSSNMLEMGLTNFSYVEPVRNEKYILHIKYVYDKLHVIEKIKKYGNIKMGIPKCVKYDRGVSLNNYIDMDVKGFSDYTVSCLVDSLAINHFKTSNETVDVKVYFITNTEWAEIV